MTDVKCADVWSAFTAEYDEIIQTSDAVPFHREIQSSATVYAL